MTTLTKVDFAKIWSDARAAANVAAMEANAKLGPEESRGLDCGFAWLHFPGNTPWARWTKKAGISDKNYPTGLSIWYSKLHDIPTQSLSVHEAAARAARDVIVFALQDDKIYVGSRYD
jgi:hypothetical protein